MSAPKINQSWQHRMMHWSGYPWLVWGLGAAFFFSEYLARLAPNVMVSQLMAQFHLNAWGIGVLALYHHATSSRVVCGSLWGTCIVNGDDFCLCS